MIPPSQVGECGRECKTIAKAAEQILGEHDTDLAERLLKGKSSRADLQQWLCFELSNACASPAPPLDPERPKGPGFVAIPQEEVHVVNMMGEMRAKGVRGKLVKPEDVLDRQPGVLFWGVGLVAHVLHVWLYRGDMTHRTTHDMHILQVMMKMMMTCLA